MANWNWKGTITGRMMMGGMHGEGSGSGGTDELQLLFDTDGAMTVMHQESIVAYVTKAELMVNTSEEFRQAMYRIGAAVYDAVAASHSVDQVVSRVRIKPAAEIWTTVASGSVTFMPSAAFQSTVPIKANPKAKLHATAVSTSSVSYTTSNPQVKPIREHEVGKTAGEIASWFDRALAAIFKVK